MPTLTLDPNTSATSTTGSFSNGNLAGSVNLPHGASQYNVHNLLYTGHTTKVLAHYLPWFDGGNDGDASHPMNLNYSNADPQYVRKMFTDMQNRGVDGVIVDYQGTTDITGTSWGATWYLIHEFPNLKFAIMLDANLLGTTSGATPTAKVLSALSDISWMLSDSSYLTYSSNPVVFDFGLTDPSISPAVDWASIQSSYPSVQFVHEDDATGNGFSVTDSAGSFSWVHANETSLGTAPDLSYLDTFYSNAITNYPSKICMASAFKGFNPNPYAPWDTPVRYTDQQYGQTWLNCFTKINNHFSTTHQLPFLQLVTWDDYFEGTALETGIDNGLTCAPTVTGTTPSATLHFNISGSGSTSTLAEISVWGYWGGHWGWSIWSASTTSISITSPGTYYVKLVGKPFIKNFLSSAITVT